MFAYCGNNPVNGEDPSGHRFHDSNIRQYGSAIFGYTDTCSGFGGEPRAELVNAEPLHRNVDDKERFNCMGNVIGRQTIKLPKDYTPGDDIETAYKAFYKDLGGARNVRRLSSVDAPLNKNEVLIAMRCGPEDLHFIILTESGWCSKSGLNPVVIIGEEDVFDAVWYPYYIDANGEVQKRTNHFYYDSEIIYIALRKDWWK